MKTLSIQQPWASLICAGIKDVENRSWQTPYRGKILIMASSKKVPKNLLNEIPIEWTARIANENAMGAIPDIDELPTSAIIGYVELEDCIQSEEFLSLWSGGDTYQWKLKDAYLFDEPITGVKGKLNLWDYPDINENNLPPAHKVERPKIDLDGTTLKMPLIDSVITDILNETEDIRHLDINDDPESTGHLFVSADSVDMKPIKKAVFTSPLRSVEFEVEETYMVNYLDDNQNPIIFPSIYGDGTTELVMIRLKLGKQLK